jgi:hypothetical protein
MERVEKFFMNIAQKSLPYQGKQGIIKAYLRNTPYGGGESVLSRKVAPC